MTIILPTPCLAVLFFMAANTLALADATQDCEFFDQQIAPCSEVIAKEPAAGWAYNNRGRIFTLLGEYNTAIADFNKAILLDPVEPIPYNNRAVAHAGECDYDLALADYNTAIRLDPMFGNAYLNRSDLYEDLGRADLSKADYAKSSLQSAQPSTRYRIGFANVGPRAPECIRAPRGYDDINPSKAFVFLSVLLGVAFLIGSGVGLIVGPIIMRGARNYLRHTGFGAGGAVLLVLLLHLDFLLPNTLTRLARFKLASLLGTFDAFTASIPVAGAGAVIGLVVGWGLSYSSPAKRAALFFPVLVLLGVAVGSAGYFLAPRDFMGLSQEGLIAVWLGTLIVMTVPFLVWRRSATRMQFLIVCLVLIALGVTAGSSEYLTVAAVAFILAFFSFREWRRIDRVGRAGTRRFAIGAFAWPFSAPSLLRRRAAGLGDEALVGAFHLPDHTPRAMAFVNRELVKRGLDPKVAPDWLPKPGEATLLPAVRESLSPERYGQLVQSRQRVLRFVRAIAFVAATAGAIGFLMWLSDNLVVLWISLVVATIASMLLGLLILVGAAIGSKRAARVLLLRPFEQARMTVALKRVVRRYLGSVGNVFTLSDRHYKPNPFIGILSRISEDAQAVLGPLFRPSFRIISVKDERTFFIMADFLIRKFKPSLLSLMCGGQAFNIRTTDSWWKRSIDLLIGSSDVIVMDISRVSTGSAWEITQLAERRALSKCLFIVQEEYKADGRASIERLLPPNLRPNLYVFNQIGNFEDADSFERDFKARVDGAVWHWGSTSDVPTKELDPVVLDKASVK